MLGREGRRPHEANSQEIAKVISSISNLELILAISELIQLIPELILAQIWVSISSKSISRVLAVLAGFANTRANTPTSGASIGASSTPTHKLTGSSPSASDIAEEQASERACGRAVSAVTPERL